MDQRRAHGRIVAELLRKLRLKAAMSQSEVAQALGKPQSFVSKYETGERRLDLPEVSDVCAVLGVALTDFVRQFQKVRDHA